MRSVRNLALVALSLSLEASAQGENRWNPAEDLTPLMGHGMAHDPLLGRTVVFGGFVNGLPQGDTWLWDGARWELARPWTNPQVRYDHAMTYASGPGGVVFFGGYSNAGIYHDDLWLWSAGDWFELPAAGSRPVPRSEASIAYDEARDRLVLFGGRDAGARYLGDTWEWDGTRWTRRFPPDAPAGRSLAGMVYDRSRERVVLFGGLPCLGDTWEWNGENWRHVSSQGPSPRHAVQMAYDEDRQRVVLFGGTCLQTDNFADTWEWDGERWSQRAPSGGVPGRALGAMAYDRARRRLVLFGGLSCGTFSCNVFADTWEHEVDLPATMQPYGVGCVGSAGVPRLAPAPGSWPWIGDTFQLVLSSVGQAAAALGVVGLSDSSWGALTLPYEFSPQGAPGCFALSSVVASFPLTVSEGEARWSLSLPPDPALVGRAFYTQAIVLDPGANARGLVVSNGVRGVVGAR